METIDQSSKANEKKLRQELDKLKGELEHRALKGDFNVNCRVMHYKMNPLAVAEEQAQEKQKAMVRELEELRRLVSTGSTAGSTQTSSLHAQGCIKNFNIFLYKRRIRMINILFRFFRCRIIRATTKL